MDRTTQDGIWYQLTPDMEKYNIKVTRAWIKQLIKKVCTRLDVSRESLGIFAGARATMYFDGNWSSVRFEAIEDLAEKGTDIIFIEKMPIIEVLTTYADKYGVALVNTIGNLTEYGKDLMRAIEASGGHAAILTDYEDYGLLIVASVLSSGVDIPRIGIDEETLRYFGLLREALLISSMGRLKNYSFLDHFDDSVVDKHFVRTRRVELDAVLAAVGSERLWEYIMYKLTGLFPIRDYNRAIAMPANEILYPESVQEFLVFIHSFVEKILKDEHKKIEESLANIEGMIDVKQKSKQIEEQLQGLVSNNEGMKLIVLKIEELSEALSKI
ncbi:MAG: hypothetical protein WAM14_01660 [Candidatus Nitrosopolaris sp.]